MKLFGRQRKSFATIFSVFVLGIMLAACGSAASGGGGTTTGGGGATGSNGKGCKKVGVLLPETATSARWDGVDRPLLQAGLMTALGTAPDYNNAEGNADDQQNQAEADLTKGDCILIVAAVDGQKAAAIVASAKAKGVPVIAYDRLIQSKDLSLLRFLRQRNGWPVARSVHCRSL